MVSFNPRSRVGSDLFCSMFSTSLSSFNPRSRVGSDVCGPLPFRQLYSFNPRSRVGSDEYYFCTRFPPSSFQSTLPRRERLKQRHDANPVEFFQSTLPRRERPCYSIVNLFINSFNPRSRVGSDDFMFMSIVFSITFNPRSRVGSDYQEPVGSFLY